jgi:hypothetical protein
LHFSRSPQNFWRHNNRLAAKKPARFPHFLFFGLIAGQAGHYRE